MEQSNGKVKVLGALAIGAAAGAALGILFAPSKGSRTRKRIIKGASEIALNIKDKIQEDANGLKSKALKLEEKVSNKAEELSKQAIEGLG